MWSGGASNHKTTIREQFLNKALPKTMILPPYKNIVIFVRKGIYFKIFRHAASKCEDYYGLNDAFNFSYYFM